MMYLETVFINEISRLVKVQRGWRVCLGWGMGALIVGEVKLKGATNRQIQRLLSRAFIGERISHENLGLHSLSLGFGRLPLTFSTASGSEREPPRGNDKIKVMMRCLKLFFWKMFYKAVVFESKFFILKNI